MQAAQGFGQEEEEDDGAEESWGFSRRAGAGGRSLQVPEEEEAPPQPVAALEDDDDDDEAAGGLDAVGPDGARWGFTRSSKGGRRPPGAGPAQAAAAGEDGEEGQGEETIVVAAGEEARAKQLMSEMADVDADVEDAMEELRRARIRDRIYDQLASWGKTHILAASLLDGQDPEAAAERRRCVAGLRDICERFLQTTETADLAALVDEADPFDPDGFAPLEELDPSMQQAPAEPEGPPDEPPKPVTLADRLRALKGQLQQALQADDAPRLVNLLQELAGLKLKWDAVREAAIGKEVGLAAKHSDAAVAEKAKAMIGTFHKLARSGKAGNSYGR